MQFLSTDAGPCWMSPAQRLATQKDRPSLKTTSTDRIVQDLRKDLQAKGVSSIPFQTTIKEIKLKSTYRLAMDLRKDLDAKGVHTGGNKKELQKRCKEAGISVQITIQEITEGWEGKPKGMLHILFERGCINPERINEYTVDGKNDAFGNHVTDACLRYWMDQLSDFQDEETLLQYHGRQIGGKVDRTPKCHLEMAGKGMEYAWACGKNVYPRLPLKDKKTKAKSRHQNVWMQTRF
jgi:hypothetical protein